jgi:DHA3 family tetracycline resistance protein-like MFS transporter
VRLLAPLRQGDFALLWAGMTVSLLGDGIYFVAVAWEAYSLSNAPTALSLVGVAWTLPTVAFLLVGGAVSDRYERRRVLLIASAAEATAIGLVGVLAVIGQLQLWMLLVLVALYGTAEAFVNPAFDAIVPSLVAISLALTGPIAQAVGARTTLLGAGAIAATAFVVLFAVPGLRDPERATHASFARG